MPVTFYYTSVTGNLEIKKQQQKIDMTLTSKNIEFNKVDVAASEDAKKKMREIAGNPTALPPQLCNGDQYCGGFDKFEEAVEAEELNQFLKL